MPVCTIFLLSLDTNIPSFISKLHESSLQPLITARVVRWIITPTTLSKHSLVIPTHPWDLMLVLPNAANSLPAGIQSMIRQSWSIQAGIPSKLLQTFPARNARLLHPAMDDIPPLTGSLSQSRVVESAQALELSLELREWITSGKGPQGAVSMLNLLAFVPGMKEEYLKYGQAFAESVGSRRGGVAKIVGKVLPSSCSDGCGEWEEIAVAHYPSLEHFADMIASDDYQDANKKWRLQSLKDTLILCTTEVDLDKPMTKANL